MTNGFHLHFPEYERRNRTEAEIATCSIVSSQQRIVCRRWGHGRTAVREAYLRSGPRQAARNDLLHLAARALPLRLRDKAQIAVGDGGSGNDVVFAEGGAARPRELGLGAGDPHGGVQGQVSFTADLLVEGVQDARCLGARR